jgi:hypothetical protein
MPLSSASNNYFIGIISIPLCGVAFIASLQHFQYIYPIYNYTTSNNLPLKLSFLLYVIFIVPFIPHFYCVTIDLCPKIVANFVSVDPVIFFSFSTMVCEFLVQGQTNT